MPTEILPFAEALERQYRTDDIKLLGLLEELQANDDIKGLLEAIAKDFVHGERFGGVNVWPIRKWISNAIDTKVAEEQAANDAKMQADSPVAGRGYRLREP